jgi:hypothetical protein
MIFSIEDDRRPTRIEQLGEIEEIKRSFGEPFGLK